MTRSGLRRGVVAVGLLVALGVAVWSLHARWAEVRSAATQLSPGALALALAFALGSLALSLLTWRSTLAALGTHVPLRPAGRIFFLGQLGKYLPGSVWPVLAQMELGAAAGLSRTQVGTASLLSLAIGVPGALLLGLLAAPALLSAGVPTYAVLFVGLPVTAVLLWPPVLNPLLERALRLARRPAPQQRLTGPAVTRIAVLSGAANVLLGLQALVLAVDLGARGATVLPLAVGGFTLAAVAGLLAVPVPAGVGVREAVLVATLSPVLPLARAVVLAVASRLVLTVADLVVAGAAAAVARHRVQLVRTR